MIDFLLHSGNETILAKKGTLRKFESLELYLLEHTLVWSGIHSNNFWSRAERTPENIHIPKRNALQNAGERNALRKKRSCINPE